MIPILLLLMACLESPSKPTPGADKATGFQVSKAPAGQRGSITVTVVGKAGPLAGAAVWLGDTGEKVPPRTAALSLSASHLTPALVVLPPGSAISLHNMEARARTVRLVDAGAAESAPALVTRELPAGATAGMPLTGTGPLRLVCGPDACPGAAVVVGQGGVTDAHGQVALPEIPAGPVRVHVWHPTAGETATTAEIAANANAAVSVALTR